MASLEEIDNLLAEVRADGPAQGNNPRLTSLDDALRKAALRQNNRSGAGAAGFRAFASGIIDQFAEIPNAVNIALSRSQGTIPRNAGDNLGPQTFSTMPNRRPEGVGGPVYNWGDQTMPVFNSNDILAGGALVGEGLAALSTGDFSQITPQEERRNQQALITEQGRAAHPTATGLSEAAGRGVATAALINQPLKLQALTRLNQAPVMQNIATKAAQSPRPAMTAGEELKNIVSWMSRSVNESSFAGWASSAGLRAGRTGMEGYISSILQGSASPEETALFASGVELVGSIPVGIITSMVGKNPTIGKAGAAALIGAITFQFADSILPGGDDYILPNLESGFNKVLLAAGTGLMFGLGGYGHGKVGLDFERGNALLADAIKTASRGSVNSVYTAMRTDTRAQKVLTKYMSDPNYFGETAKRRIERGILNDDVSLIDSIETLFDEREFRDKFNELNK